MMIAVLKILEYKEEFMSSERYYIFQ
jgi:hypothetical protein